MLSMKKSLSISSERKNYSVHFMKNENELVQALSTFQKSVIVIDRNITERYPVIAKEMHLLAPLYTMDVLEQHKTLKGVEDVLHFFQSANVNRSTTVIAIGGGVLQDMTAFAAHIYNRGLSVILVPTTLLSMCDSCVGGKCGVNFNGYKNQLGAFHPPKNVFIWSGFLASLSDVDIQSGYGEILKYMLLNSKEHYDNFKKMMLSEKLFNDELIDYIYTGLKTKKKIIERDEFDTDMRRLLNYGHTFGHAIERATDNAIPHGIAVTKGIDIANYIAWKLGLLNKTIFIDIHLLIKKYFPWPLNSDISAEVLLANAEKDKKIRDRKLHLVLMENMGQFKIEPMSVDKMFVALLRGYLCDYGVGI